MPAPPNPFSDAALTPDALKQYLQRINVDLERIGQPPSLALLSELQLKHLESVPKDTTSLHVKQQEWNESKAISMASNWGGMPQPGDAAFDRIVRQHQGAFCFTTNSLFARLLRSFGFRVSECVSRCYKALGNNPRTHPEGWIWGSITHELLIVDWPESNGARYIADAMWGPNNLAIPILLKDQETVHGLNEYEGYHLRYENLPQSPGEPAPIDTIKGWTLYRRCGTPVGTKISFPVPSDNEVSEDGSYWSPTFHMLPISVPVQDIALYQHYSASHALASFTNFFMVTKLIPGGQGARRSLMYSPREGEGDQPMAKVFTTDGPEAQGSSEQRDVKWIPLETKAMRKWMEDEMGYRFD
ncbi:hypothetical protein OIO90_000060 [Microbotryomycetes sp. JL221]|nr:hypothetical protein OIO90_000060 [Microbotryomycetes sp. JL221]